MAGVRKKAGRYQGWYRDYEGNRKFFTGTRNRLNTLRIAKRLEDDHRQIKLGYRPVPKTADKHKKRPFVEVRDEYLAWGKSQGGRGGRPWGKCHAQKRENRLKWWHEQLALEALGDLEGILSAVEEVLRQLQSDGKAGKTLQGYAESLKSFCLWCVKREYLLEDPLKHLSRFDTTPVTRRRALTCEEISEVLRAAPQYRRLLYEVAFTTGLRANELRSLTIEHLDLQRGGLYLDAEWTKNRKPGFQYLPSRLLSGLVAFAESGMVIGLYQTFYGGRESPLDDICNPLLYVPSHPARELDKDLATADIPKHTPEGKVDFHACRNAYISLLFEAGASTKEAQTLARHSTPDLTINTYARTREDRLTKLTEEVGDRVLPSQKCALYVPAKGKRGSTPTNNSLENKELELAGCNGGGGIRTPVP